jgi:spermidine/putrescine transport system substrate-binding protein
MSMNWKLTAAAAGLSLLASTGLASAEGELNIFNWGN